MVALDHRALTRRTIIQLAVNAFQLLLALITIGLAAAVHSEHESSSVRTLQSILLPSKHALLEATSTNTQTEHSLNNIHPLNPNPHNLRLDHNPPSSPE